MRRIDETGAGAGRHRPLRKSTQQMTLVSSHDACSLPSTVYGLPSTQSTQSTHSLPLSSCALLVLLYSNCTLISEGANAGS